MAVNKVHQPVRKVRGKVRAVIAGAVLEQPPRDVYARVFFVRELDVGIGLVVAQQDVEARLPLLDEVVLERERFLVVVEQNVLDIARFRDQRAGLDIREPVVVEVAADAAAEIVGLADVDYGPVRVLIEVHAWQQGQLRSFVAEVHDAGGL